MNWKRNYKILCRWVCFSIFFCFALHNKLEIAYSLYKYCIYFFYVFIRTMKKLFLGFMISFFIGWIVSAYNQEGFDAYNEVNWEVDFTCSTQCFIRLWPISAYDYLDMKWSFQWNWSLGYAFLVWNQIYQWEMLQSNWWWILDQRFTLTNSPSYVQIPKSAELMIMFQGNIVWTQLKIDWWLFGFFVSLSKWFTEAMQYQGYNSRIINFLEWPKWNWRFINQSFFNLIIFLLSLVFLSYWFKRLSAKISKKRLIKGKHLLFLTSILVFFWIFFDFFSSVNQIRMYKDIMNTKDIMVNWRLGKQTDFYGFLDFIKTQIPKWEKWFFMAPYPFGFEWTFHIYPDVKFGPLTWWVHYVFYYNLFWSNNWVGFTDPLYSGWLLQWNSLSFRVDKEIQWKPYARIYLLNNK